MKLCNTFWSLSKGAQDAVLWGIQTMSFKTEKEETENDSSDYSSIDESEMEDAGATSSSSSSSEETQVNNWYIQG